MGQDDVQMGRVLEGIEILKGNHRAFDVRMDELTKAIYEHLQHDEGVHAGQEQRLATVEATTTKLEARQHDFATRLLSAAAVLIAILSGAAPDSVRESISQFFGMGH